jgi:hypothetical protein
MSGRAWPGGLRGFCLSKLGQDYFTTAFWWLSHGGFAKLLTLLLIKLLGCCGSDENVVGRPGTFVPDEAAKAALWA